MASFKDETGTPWEVAITVATVKRVRELTGVDLMKTLTKDDPFQELAGDPVKLVDVLYATIRPQLDAKGISDEQFAARIAGDSIESATSALMEAVADFSPGPRRALMRGVVAKARDIHSRTMELALQRLEKIDPDAEAMKLLGNASGSGQESQASTPTPFPSVNSESSPKPPDASDGSIPATS